MAECLSILQQLLVAGNETMDGSTGVSSQPDVSFSFNCSNCDDMDLDMFDVATDGMAASFDFGELDVSPPGNFTQPIRFTSMTSENMASELPEGENEIELVMGLVNFSQVSFDAPTNVGPFQYSEAGTLISINTFTVPEPATTALQLVALAALAGLARRRARRAR